jgi:hypothetical protein
VTESILILGQTILMTTQGPKIESAERSDNGVVIEFADGKSAFYPAELLYRVLPDARPIEVVDEGEPDN